MDDATEKAWRAKAQALYKGLASTGERGATRAYSRGATRSHERRLSDTASMVRRMTTVISHAARDHGGWTDAVAREALLLPCRKEHEASGRLALRCMKLSLAQVTGDRAGLSPAEVLAAFGESLPDRPVTAGEGGGDFGVRAAFLHVVPAGRGTAYEVGGVDLRVPRRRASEFRVGCVLPHERGSLTILRDGDDWYRPVLAPGLWSPVTEARFAEAVEGRDPWRDDPLAERREVAPLSLHERSACVANPEGKDHDEAFAQATGKAQGLVSIDGVVHVRIEAPTVRVVTWLRGQSCFHGSGWKAGDLTSEDDMDLTPSLGPEPSYEKFALPTSCATVVDDYLDIVAPRVATPVRRLTGWVPSDEPADVAAVTLACLRANYLAHGHAPFHGGDAEFLSMLRHVTMYEGRRIQRETRLQAGHAPYADTFELADALLDLADRALGGAYERLADPVADEVEALTFIR